MPEFDLIKRIERIFKDRGAAGGADCVLGIGDDAAIVNVPGEQQLAVCTDTLVAGVHFRGDAPARSIGHKALAVNLSDLAAMGAEPSWFLLALTLPHADPAWVDDFSIGMAELARSAGVVLAGGDTTSGPLSITVTAAGTMPRGKALTRSAAMPGDQVYLSGTPGRAAMAVHAFRDGGDAPAACLAALDYPYPRIALGLALRDLASACIDISDGLAADLGHILDRSGVGAELVTDALPRANCFDALSDEQRWSLQLGGGDDYELCFTVPPGKVDRLEALQLEDGLRLSRIGSIRRQPGLSIRRSNGEAVELQPAGYEHFGSQRQVDA